MQKITPFLWFDQQAEEAANFYTSLFKDSRITGISYYGEGGPGPRGSVFTVNFVLEGQEFIALNGGPTFKFNEAISFFVDCPTQAEVDRLWDKLTEGGEEGQCGWLKDKYGLSWQIVPSGLNDLLNGQDAEGSRRAMQAMLQMKKLDIEKLRLAYERG
ncbi:MAG: VOC family protein [Anaerolineales bacterium]|jgi:predicted 3-demethylubiquinone-9 3-methyltransferase (glyoxalase superfamily)